MSAANLSLVAGAISPTGFGLLAWGAILLVAIAFIYIVWSLLADWR